MERRVIIKTPQQIANIRQSWKLLNELLYILFHATKVWTNLLELEDIAENFMRKNNVRWAFKWYEWFPTNLCLSVNDCAVHGIPCDYVLQNWDLLKIDCWIVYKWWISDSAICVPVWWEIANPEWYKLAKSTKKALDIAIKKIWPGKMVFDYADTVENSIINDWFSILKTLTWHGVWVEVHEPPHIYNYPHEKTKQIKLVPNMVICLEPITAITSNDIVEKEWQDWNLYTKKWDLGAQREYMVLITESGYEILSGITEEII